MNTTIVSLTEKVRKALDDIAPSVTDDFSSDLNAEIEQALLHAAMSLSETLPVPMLNVTVVTINTVKEADGSKGYAILPDDYMRLVSVRMNSWKGGVPELIERGSEAEKRQRSKWSQGTNSKPKVMLDGEKRGWTEESIQVIRLWPCNDSTIFLSFIPKAKIENGSLVCALKDGWCEKNLIYLTCRIILEGKKEVTTAEAFAKLTEI